MSDHLNDLFSEEFKQEPEIETDQDEVTQDLADTQETPEVEAEIEPTDDVAEIEAPDEEEAKEPKYVPLPTFLDMRDRMKEYKAAQAKAEAEAAAFQRQLEEYRNEVAQTFDAPDPQSDPQGYNQLVKDQIAQAVYNERLMMSHNVALRNHDAETVAAAVEWATQRVKSDTQFDAEASQQADPVEWAIQQHKVVKELDAFKADPIAAAKKIAMEQGWLTQGTAQVAPITPPQKAKNTPKSLTDVPTATTASKGTTGDIEADFNAIFDR